MLYRNPITSDGPFQQPNVLSKLAVLENDTEMKYLLTQCQYPGVPEILLGQQSEDLSPSKPSKAAIRQSLLTSLYLSRPDPWKKGG